MFGSHLPFTAIRCPERSTVSPACASIGFITTPENDSDEILIQVVMFGSNCLGDNRIDSFSVRWILSLNLVSSKMAASPLAASATRLKSSSTCFWATEPKQAERTQQDQRRGDQANQPDVCNPIRTSGAPFPQPAFDHAICQRRDGAAAFARRSS